MTASGTTSPTRSPLSEWYRSRRVAMDASQGVELPVAFSDPVREHLAVRSHAGAFDLSHLGVVELAGADALAVVQLAASNDVSALESGRVQATALTSAAGGVVDLARAYRMGAEHFLLVVSAARAASDLDGILRLARDGADLGVLETTGRYALIGIEGPAAEGVLRELTDADLDQLPDDGFASGEVAGARATIGRAGFTGEAGFEILVPRGSATRVWEALVAAGREIEVVPVGLAARDSLCLEAATRFPGRDVDEDTTLLEAGLEHVIGWGKEAFTGKAVLEDQRVQGVVRRLAGIELTEPGMPARGDVVLIGGVKAGTVTSGGRAPSLGKAVGLAYLPAGHAAAGVEVEVDCRDRRARAKVVPLPFYSRPKG